MLSVSEALSIVLQQAKPLPAVDAALTSLTVGQVLGESVISDIDSPPYAKAMMDGYAVRSQDAVAPNATLRVIDEVAAGKLPTKALRAGEATRIMTGAPVPEGADAVVMIEQTEHAGTGEVKLLAAATRGQNILERGAEMKTGDQVLQPGDVLGPQEFGLLAAVGRATVSVYPKPRVAIISTGDEVVEPGRTPGPGQIRNTNGSMLAAQAARAGASVHYLGIAGDDPESLRSSITEGLDGYDVLILSGGVSAGKFDLVPGVLQKCGVVSRFHKVYMKPGKPLLFGSRDKILVFGLPGNPVSSFVCFELFVRVALQALSGHAAPTLPATSLPIVNEIQTDNDRPTFWPARIEIDQNGIAVRALPWSGSADLRALHTANALLSVPPGKQHYEPKQSVPVLLLDC